VIRIAVAGCCLAAGVGAGLAIPRNAAPALPPIVAPGPAVVVKMEPPSIVLPEPPPPPPAPLPPIVHPPRPLSPVLDADCMLPPDIVETDAPSTCGWDDGFPAISKDGRTIAMKYSADPGPRGGSSVAVRFVDAKTSRVTREITLLSPDEFFADKEARDKVRAQIPGRVESVQRMLDAGQFRAMIPMGSSKQPLEDRDHMHAEIVGGAARIVDPVTASVVWQGHFGAPAPHVEHPEEAMCSSWNLAGLSLWWDPVTKSVLGQMMYRTGGCMCTDEEIEQVATR
jgi:hypothetical protein